MVKIRCFLCRSEIARLFRPLTCAVLHVWLGGKYWTNITLALTYSEEVFVELMSATSQTSILLSKDFQALELQQVMSV